MTKHPRTTKTVLSVAVGLALGLGVLASASADTAPPTSSSPTPSAALELPAELAEPAPAPAPVEPAPAPAPAPTVVLVPPLVVDAPEPAPTPAPAAAEEPAPPPSTDRTMDSPPLLPSGELCTHCTAAADVVGYLNVGPGPTNGYCTRTDAHTAAGGIAAGVLVREPLCDPLGVIKPGDTAPPATDSQ